MPPREDMKILGLMSGTSLDGIDFALCRFSEGGTKYEILKTHTYAYDDAMKRMLRSAEQTSGEELEALSQLYGRYTGELCKTFLNGDHADYIASHGHTVFHEPAKGITYQMGDGAAIAQYSGVTTINDFRITDVRLGGQGAPLVPVGDQMLFSAYTYCLNIGGFANVSYEENGRRIAFDIVPVNYVMNRLAQRVNAEFDAGGRIAASGNYIPFIGEQLDRLPFYSLTPPKSLGREWVEQHVFPLLSESESPADLMRTFSEHAAKQIGKPLSKKGKALVTGGGAYNDFFIGELKKHSAAEIVIPDDQTVQFKEALIFALLGYLRVHNKVNALASVTGATRDSCGGTIHFP
jgi:anhydro-N-acetylmuramic acid kinase